MAEQNNGLVKRPVEALKAVLKADSVKEQFENALGKSSNEFTASLIDLYTGDKALQDCNPSAVVAQALKAAVLKLPLVKAMGQAYVVVYKNKGVPTPTFIIGYKGLIQLAKRSGLYEKMNAGTIYEGELMGVDKLTGDLDITGKKTSDKVVGYFAYFREVNGFSKGYYMSVEDMVHYAKTYSASCMYAKEEALMEAAQRNTVSKGVGWLANFGAMAEKTCLRQLLSKWGSLSVEMQTALVSDDNRPDAAVQRNEVIEDEANSQYIDLNDYEVLDTETGEVSEQPTQQQAADEDEMPNY